LLTLVELGTIRKVPMEIIEDEGRRHPTEDLEECEVHPKIPDEMQMSKEKYLQKREKTEDSALQIISEKDDFHTRQRGRRSTPLQA